MSDCEKILAAASRDDVSEETAATIEAHVAECPRCAGELERLRETGRSAGEAPMPDEARWEGAWRRIEERGFEAPTKRCVRAAAWRGFAVTAAAAAVLVAAYIFAPETKVTGTMTAGSGVSELLSVEVPSPDYDLVIEVSEDDDVPVIWVEKI
jgi:hypothetical protein